MLITESNIREIQNKGLLPYSVRKSVLWSK
jgi:hypothetical protein